MKKNIIAFGASNSSKSINKSLASYVASLVENADISILDLNDFEMPIYSMDREKTDGIPELAHQFKNHLESAHGIIISFAEHNGSYTVAYKNIYDWVSRIEKDIWGNKPMFLLSTSPGPRGGKSVMETALNSISRMNESTITHFSLPSFRQNFSLEDGITDKSLDKEFRQQLLLFADTLIK